MKILVVGAGAVGGYFGGRLALAGHDVFFMARGAHLRALQSDGLRVESINGDFSVKPPARERFEHIKDLGLILVCVKHKDTAEILPVLREQLSESTIVITLQNGVDTEKELEQAVPAGQIVGGIAYIGSAVAEPGLIRHTAAGKITIGEMGEGRSERLSTIERMFSAAKISVSVSDSIVKAKWEKLLWNVGFNALCAMTGLSCHKLLHHAPAREVIRHLMEEHIEVARRLGIELNPALAGKYIENTAKGGDIIPSMLQDARNGRRTEIEIMNGKIVDEAGRLGIAVPYNETVWAAVSAMDAAAVKG